MQDSCDSVSRSRVKIFLDIKQSSLSLPLRTTNRTAVSHPKTRNNKFSLPVYRNFGSIDRWIDRKFVPSRVQSRSIMILDDTRTSANVELDFPIETTFSHHLRGVSLALI